MLLGTVTGQQSGRFPVPLALNAGLRDFTLEATERFILEEVARRGQATLLEIAEAARVDDDAAEPLLFGLRMMGYLTVDGSRYRVGNSFFERWLKRSAAAAATTQA
jgi:hypothetical protein